MRKPLYWRLAAVVAAIMFIAAGCSGGQGNDGRVDPATSQASPKSQEQGGNNEHNKPDEAVEDTIVLKTEEGNDVVITNKAEIPEGFPSDVPMPEEIIITSSISGDGSATITIKTEMPFEEVSALYHGYAKDAGFIAGHVTDESDFLNYSGQRGNEEFVVTLMLDSDDNETVTGILIYAMNG